MSTSTAADREVADITRGLGPTPNEYVNFDGRPNSAPQKKTRIITRERPKSVGANQVIMIYILLIVIRLYHQVVVVVLVKVVERENQNEF